MIESHYFWQTILFLALGTIVIRGTFIFLSAKVKISPRVREIFAYIPVAVLPALITPMVFFHQGQSAVLFGKERFVVLILSSLICYATKSMLATVVFGLLLLYGVA